MAATLTAAPQVSSVRSAAAEGARDIVPMTISVLPFGLAIGAMLAKSSIGTFEALLSGPAILAGAAQITTAQMLDSGAAPVLIVVTALLINARLALYGAAMAPWFQGESLRRRLLLAIPLIDQLYFVGARRFGSGDLDRRGRQAYWFGAAGVLVAGWCIVQAVAILGGARLPAGAALHMGAPLALAGMLAKSTDGRPAIAAATVAALVAVVGVGLPMRSGVLVSALVGIAAGIVVHRLDAAVRHDRPNDPRLDATASGHDRAPDPRLDAAAVAR